MSRQMNDEITECGLKYLGQYNKTYFEIIGTNWGLKIPINRMGEFTKLFTNINWESGAFIKRIKGCYVRVTIDDNMDIYALHHITKNIDYIVQTDSNGGG